MSTLTIEKQPARHIPDRLSTPAGRILGSWEALLAAVAIAIFIVEFVRIAATSSIPGTCRTRPSISPKRR